MNLNLTTQPRQCALSNHDRRYLDAALRLARKHQGITGTNPSVACLLVNQINGKPVIVGSAVTARGGRPHAEPPAIAEAGPHVKGATAYVTLEPCSHHGKTPPCSQTLIDAGVARVVTATTDPDNRVNGQGHAMLMDAGIEVVAANGGEMASRVLQGYLKARTDVRPFVTLKLAMTSDGLIGARKVPNLKISCEASIRQTHLARARHDCILVGSGTAVADDPMLSCRLPGMEDRSPTRIVLDAKCRLNADFALISTARQFPTLVVSPADAPRSYLDMLFENGAMHLPCDMHGDRVALPEMLEDIAARGHQSVMVEGGAALAQSFLADGLVDELVLHMGEGVEPVEETAEPVRAAFTPTTPPDGFIIRQELRFGSDVSIRMRREGETCLQEL